MVLEVLAFDSLAEKLPKSDITSDRSFEGYDGIFRLDSDTDEMESADDVLDTFASFVIDSVVLRPGEKKVIVPLNGGLMSIVAVVDKIKQRKKLGAEGGIPDGFDIRAWYRENVVFSFHGKEGVDFFDTDGIPVESFDEVDIDIVDDIADSLKTYKDVALRAADPKRVSMYTPTSKLQTVTTQYETVGREIEGEFGLPKGAINLRNKIHTVKVFPNRNVNANGSSPIWITGGAGLNRGSKGDSETINALQRLCSKYYYVRMNGTDPIVDFDTELAFLRRYPSVLVDRYAELPEKSIFMEHLKNDKDYKSAAISASLLMDSIFNAA